MKVLVTGGCRSGKSRRAQALAESLGEARLYLATAQALDAEMEDRIARHQADRGPGWTTVEEPLAIAQHLNTAPVVLLDCLTLWVSNLMHARPEEDLLPEFDALAQAISDSSSHIIVVTNEVGLGIVPMNPLARRFRDNAGWLAQRVGAVCDHIELCVAGVPMSVK